jgi:hypothetical protein
MKVSDRYHKWIEWSEEDAAYLGKCPDLITGIHGEDPVRRYAELHEVVEDVIPTSKLKGSLFLLPRATHAGSRLRDGGLVMIRAVGVKDRNRP